MKQFGLKQKLCYILITDVTNFLIWHVIMSIRIQVLLLILCSMHILSSSWLFAQLIVQIIHSLRLFFNHEFIIIAQLLHFIPHSLTQEL